MKFFACLLDTGNAGIPDHARQRAESVARRRDLECCWEEFPGGAVLTAWDDIGGEISVVADGPVVAVGQARLDNRADIARRIGIDYRGMGSTDLELVLHIVTRLGPSHIRDLLGDFAFVIWDTTTRTAIAARDAFGVPRLYYSRRDSLTAFGSRSEPISYDDSYDLTYLADTISFDSIRPELTVYRGVQSVPAATILRAHQRGVTQEQYWTAQGCQASSHKPVVVPEAIETCRELLITSISQRLGDVGHSWAQLSGGLDSSSIVSLAGWLSERGQARARLAGTVTFVDGTHTGADERMYSDAVLERWPVRNESIVDVPMWPEPAMSGPLPDLPHRAAAAIPRDQRICDVLRRTNARVLLTGWGGDQLFTGSMVFFADWLAEGRIGATFKALADRSARGRLSFWNLAFKNAVMPLLPPAIQRRAVREFHETADYLRWDTFRRLGMPRHAPEIRYNGRFGHKYAHFISSEVGTLSTAADWEAISDVVSVRHPFLYRPLVEFALCLPPELCVRPYARKWILREGMKGILPEVVRTRVGKGGGGDAVTQMFSRHRTRFTEMARNPILAELGLIDGRRFQAAVERATTRLQKGDDATQGHVMRTLSVEMWLQVQSGRQLNGSSTQCKTVAPHHNYAEQSATFGG